MALHSAEAISTHLLMWRRVREYAVPPSMIEKAAARSAAGDWAGACAAARIDVDLDLRAVRHRHGTDLTTRVRADLRRLAPDLLRWHMPRIAPDGRLRPGLTLALARYDNPGTAAVRLVVRTPPAWADAGQRMSLALWEADGDEAFGHHPHPRPDRRFRLDLHRHLWDGTRSGDLAGRHAAAGDPYAPGPPERSERPEHHGRPAGHEPWPPPHWAAEAERLLRAEGRPRGALTVRTGVRSQAVLELVAPDDSHVPELRPVRDLPRRHETAALPVLPDAAARPLPDLELLRAGLLTADRLHPLVAAALTGPADTARAPGARTPAVPPGPADTIVGGTDPNRVACSGQVHRIELRNGVLAAVDHDPAQLAREALLVALGGPGLPCLRAIDTAHRTPEALPSVRERLAHGDVHGALAVLEGLLGPAAVLREGPLRDALDAAVAGRLDHGRFRSGLVLRHPAADVGVDAGRRPRIDRRVPQPIRSKRGARSRPRTGLPG
ncbi:hypothetical protein [Streptomyces sp. NPDC101132]|uniref:hypothetical protein n=1 Tax=Streptomyces sp. NPDC101132 TaxID=3366110 RepID=UPI00381CB629